MTTLARNQSDRVSGLVYLDALGDLEDDPSADPEWLALLKKVPTELRPQPVCDPWTRARSLRIRGPWLAASGSSFRNPSSATRLKTLLDRSVSRSPRRVSRAIGQ